MSALIKNSNSSFYEQLVYIPELEMYVACLYRNELNIFLYDCKKQKIIAREINRYTAIPMNLGDLKTISFYFMDTGILVCNTLKVPIKTVNGFTRYQQARKFYFIDYEADE